MLQKRVIITGASGGIGKATASLLKKNGWLVIGIDKNGKNNECDEFLTVDLSNSNKINKACEKIIKKHNSISGLVNNASILITKSIAETKMADWDLTMDTNVRSAFLLTKLFAPVLKPDGAIVNISSVHAQATSNSISAYAASKGALVGFTRAAALELAGDGIRVNAVLPGAVNTNMLKSGLSRGHLESNQVEQQLEELAQKTPLKKIGKPKDIAELIYFLIDNSRSSYITGQTFTADGGALARLSTE
ncbi:SDR family oxidoreductase [Patescibacteria group bacterium]|nr:SDR family oxidoreductase [Patescibacteria group bacterium]MBU1889980.1 SDR family oxidoreductase [Patescibacteria group bacterium]